MENNERDRKLDQWLDEALSEYSAAEPRFGLEQRVLNRIRGEEQRSRKWNFWRWMPAFGAIAALVVVALAVRPVIEKKAPVGQQLKSRMDTYSRSTEKPAQSASTEPHPQSAANRTKQPNQPELNDKFRETPTIKQELSIVPEKETVAQGGDRDRLVSSQGARINNQLRATRSFAKNAPASADNAASLNNPAMAMAPPPPPPPPPLLEVQPGVGAVAAGVVAGVPTMKAAPTNAHGTELKSSAETVEVQSASQALLKEKIPAESLSSVIAKDARRKEAHAKPDTPPQDANTIQAFGVTVRFQTAPTTQQFPTPVPLSNQEKLALKAARELKDSAFAQHKSTEITPIEIKNIEIKPLEGTEKEK